MQNYATVGSHQIPLSPLDTIRVVASHAGFEDVDCEPTGNGFEVRATATGKSVSVRGKTLESVCDRFISSCLG